MHTHTILLITLITPTHRQNNEKRLRSRFLPGSMKLSGVVIVSTLALVASTVLGAAHDAVVADAVVADHSVMGPTWTERFNSRARYWTSIASSSDGTVRFAGAALHARRTTQTTWLPLAVVGEGTVESRRVLLPLTSVLPTTNPITYRNSPPLPMVVSSTRRPTRAGPGSSEEIAVHEIGHRSRPRPTARYVLLGRRFTQGARRKRRGCHSQSWVKALSRVVVCRYV